MAFFKWFTRSKSGSTKDSSIAPPAYDLATSSSNRNEKASSATTHPLTVSSAPDAPITASSIPQWLWNKQQCIDWITAVLIEKCFYDPSSPNAKEKAEALLKDGGFGPTLYMRTPATWAKHLGAYDGHAIHAILLSYRDKEGAVPRNVNVHQGDCEVCVAKKKVKDADIKPAEGGVGSVGGLDKEVVGAKG